MRGCGDHTPCERSESEQSCEASGAEHFVGWGISQRLKLYLYVVQLSTKCTKEGQPHYQWTGSKSADEVNGRQWAVHVRVFFPDDGALGSMLCNHWMVWAYPPENGLSKRHLS